MKDVLGGVHGLASFLAAFFHYNFNVIVCTHRTHAGSAAACAAARPGAIESSAGTERGVASYKL